MLKQSNDNGIKLKKPVRSSSGVTPLTVVLKPRKCDHGTCIYCPGGDFVPQSYTDKSPAIMRAMALNYDPYIQVIKRLEVLDKMGHPTDKIELIILGGTFLQYGVDYQYDFIKKCYDALNGINSKTLSEAKKINESAKHRCVAMCIENRPDNCSESEIKRMLEFGCTRVEIGVQIPDDSIYKRINRGHNVKDVVEATERLKNAGFKVGYHFMPGLPYSNPKKDLKLFKMLFEDERFKPDQLKIYPCQIVESSPLALMYKKINYKPYTTEQMQDLLRKMIPVIPEYCRIMRIMREIPKEKMVVNPMKLDIRKDIEEDLKKKGIKINEIRMREIGFNESPNGEELKLKIIKYSASKGKEYFLEVVNKKNILYGLLRLRIVKRENNNPSNPPSGKDIVNGKIPLNKSSTINYNLDNLNFKKNIALVRELHIYGRALKLGEEGKISQHTGLGKWLMAEAEKIALKEKCGEIKVISGVGVRLYYEKLGYKLDEGKGEYMVKFL